MAPDFNRYLLWFLSASSALLGLSYAAILYLDPLQIFHQAWDKEDHYIREMRLQAAGIINSVEFDSVILGTSMAANFSPAEASELWQSRFVNLSPDGSALSERELILRRALKHKDLKHVILSLDSYGTFGRYNEKFPVQYFDFLYNDNPWDDFKVYSHAKYFSYLFCGRFPWLSKQRCSRRRSLETVAGWQSSPFHMNRFGGLERWFEHYDNNSQVKRVLSNIVGDTKALLAGKRQAFDVRALKQITDNQRDVFDHYLLPHVQANPGVQFYFFFPPYSRLHDAFLKELKPTLYAAKLDRITHAVRSLEKYPNASVYVFDHLGFTADMANYKDTTHYHPRYNSMMLRWMHDGEHRLSSSRLGRYLSELDEQLEAYDVLDVGRRVKRYVEQGTYSGPKSEP